MKRFFRSNLILPLIVVVMLAGAIAGPLAANFIRAHAQAPAMLSFTKTAPDTVEQGGTIPYVLTLTNIGTVEIFGLQVTDTLPPQLTAITAGPTPTIVTGNASISCPPPITPPAISCKIDFLAPGAVVRITFSATVDPSLTSGTITNTATAVSTTTPVNKTATKDTTITAPTPSHRKLFVLLQGLSSELTPLQESQNKLVGFDQSNGIVAYLMSHGFGKADFLEYSYPIDLPPSVLPPVRRFLLAHEHPYSCFDTFDHSLNQDVRTLDLQIRAYLQEVGHKNTDVYLIGDSLGGAIGFGYLSLLKTKGWSALPNGGQLKGVITLDAPLGGVPNADLGAIQAVFDTKCGRGPARSIDPLDELETVFFDNTGEAKPLGGTADLTHVIFPKFSVPTGFDNQQLADEAASHNIHVLTIGNDRDFGYAIANCDILNFTSLVDYVTSQFVHNEPPLSGVYGREISVSVRNNQQCTLDLLHFEINHGAVLTDSTVQKGIVDFIENNNPDPLLSPAELLA